MKALVRMDLWKLCCLIFSIVVIVACSSDDTSNSPQIESFDRQEVLINWADNIIVPSYQSFQTDLTDLQNLLDDVLTTELDIQDLQLIKESWRDSYNSWQRVSMFEIGPAETLNFRNQMNVFPVDVELVEENISSTSYNLSLPSNNDARGFPALDYLFFAKSDAEIIASFQSSEARRQYVLDVVDYAVNLTNEVLSEWQNSYRDEFVSRDGTSASSSFNKMANDYMFYYEKALRANKIGIPAGVFSTTNVLPDRVEGFYSRQYSGELFNIALEATLAFFNGKSLDNRGTGDGFSSYLNYLNTINDNSNLALRINDQFDNAREEAVGLTDFVESLNTGPEHLLAVYDELQKNVVQMKTEMFQAMNIRVDYVDADGD